MAYRSTKARITGKIKSGGFNQPDNTLAKAIDTGAGIMSKGILKKAEEDRLEAREEKKRAAAAARSLAAAQSKKEEAARKNQRIVNSIATRFGVELQNTGAMAHIMNEVEIHGTEAINVIQRDVNDKKFNLTDVEITEEVVTGHSPDQAPPFRLRPAEDGSMRTTLDIPQETDDLLASSEDYFTDEQNRSNRAELESYNNTNYNDQQLKKGEVKTVTTTSQGFAFDPAAKKVEEVDFTNIQSVADVDGMLRNIKVNNTTYSPTALQELKNMRSAFYAKEGAAWITEASGSKDKAYAAMQQFQAIGDTVNSNIAKGIYTGWMNQEKPYDGLLDPTSFIGKSSQELRDTKAVATSMGAPIDGFDIIDNLIKSTDIIEADEEAQKYITGASSYDKTVSQIEAALQSGDYTADSTLISHLNNIARKQQKQEIESNVGTKGVIAVDGLYRDPETNEQRFAIILRYPDGTSKLRKDGTEVEYTPLSTEEAKAFAKLSVQTNTYAQELSTSATAIAEGLRNSENVIQIARSDERVRNAGGSVAQFITSFARGGDSVLSVVQDAFDDNGPDYVLTEQDLRSKLKARGISEGVLTAALSDKVSGLADKTARFEAGILALVFRSGRMEGQAGNAMSNKDFERLNEMLNVKGGIEAFETTVRGYMKDKILSYDDKAMSQDATGAIASFKELFKWSPVEEAMSFEDLVTKRDEDTLTAAYQATMGVTNTTRPSATIPQGAKKALTADPSLRKAFDEKYGAGEAAKVLGD